MSTQCQVCTAKTDAYLCRDHVKILRRTLERLPGLLDDLEDLRVGRVRMGDRGQRTGTRSSDLHGDDNPVDQLPGCGCDEDCTCDLTKARMERERRALRRALASGGANAAASALCADVGNGLTTWVRHMVESRGLRMYPVGFIGPLPANGFRRPGRPKWHARWLAEHVKAVALDEGAEELYSDAIRWEAKIRRLVDRKPPDSVPVGPCPGCGTELRAPDRDAKTVACAACDVTFDAWEVFEYGSQVVRAYSFTVEELLDTVLPAKGIHVHRRFVQYVVRPLTPTGYAGQAPRYLYADVEKALAKRREVSA